MQRHIVYIPGLGSRYDMIRKLGLLLWKRPGTKVTYVPMRWADPSETYEEKLARVGRAIERYPDSRVVVVGESAGGAVAVVARKRYDTKVSFVVTICGKNHGVDTVSPKLYRKNSAFKAAVQAADATIPRLDVAAKASMMTIYSTADLTVRPSDTLIAGVEAYDMKTPGHMMTIFTVLFLRQRLVTNMR